MGKINTYIKYNIIAVITFIASACNVHQWPEHFEPEPVILPFTLSMNFDTTMPLYTVIEHQSSRANAADGYDVRYIIKAYAQSDARQDERQECFHMLVTKDDVSALNHSVDMEIEEGRYIFRVWADYVKAAQEDDLFYNTSSFTNIHLQGEHTGNSDFRDAFVGEIEVDINPTTSYAMVEMRRPLAKFNFISTDLEQFVEHVLELRAEAEKRSEKKSEKEAQENDGIATASEDDASEDEQTEARSDNTTQESDTESGVGEDITRGVDMSDFKVVFKYAGNMPSAFNMFTNRPSDVQTGVHFNSKLTKLSDQEAELGFDYVFVNGAESIVQLAIEVYDKDGTLISSTDPYNVPLRRSMLTTIKAEFLTSRADGGVGIVPEFDGEFNYEVK